jgi:hypothetical protein
MRQRTPAIRIPLQNKESRESSRERATRMNLTACAKHHFRALHQWLSALKYKITFSRE